MLRSSATSGAVNPADLPRWAFLALIGTAAILALTRAKHVLYVVAFTGYVGPGHPPSSSDFYVPALGGVLLACFFILLGCNVVFDAFRKW